MRHALILSVAFLLPGFACASIEIPLEWESIDITIEQRGKTTIAASRTNEGFLNALSVSVRGTQIDIPQSCFPSSVPIYLNAVDLSYGEFEDNLPYWTLKLGVDYETAFNGVGTYNLVLLKDRVKLAYIEYAESETVLVDEPPLCGSW